MKRLQEWLRTGDVQGTLFFLAQAVILWFWSTWPS